MKMVKNMRSMKKMSGFMVILASIFYIGSVQACPLKDGSYHTNKFEAMDTNKDGSVTKAEFDAMHQTHFVAMDKNKDGAVSRDEMKASHEAMHADHHEKMQKKVEAEKLNGAEKVEKVEHKIEHKIDAVKDAMKQ